MHLPFFPKTEFKLVDYLKNKNHSELQTFELGVCSNIPNRSVVISSFLKPYRIYLHPLGHDQFISDQFTFGETSANFFENAQRIQMENVLTKKSLILDIGANIGIHTLYFASIGHEIHAFEPLKSNYKLLECSLKANEFTNVKLNKFGLSNKSESVCMTSQLGNMGHSVIHLSQTNCVEKMETRVLGDYLEQELKGRVPDVIKIDVEGFEYWALESSQVYFKKYGTPKYIFSEFHTRNFLEVNGDPLKYLNLLTSMGYAIYNGEMETQITNLEEYARYDRLDDLIMRYKDPNDTME